MLKRPSKQDTEEDLLRFQEEFLASKTAPSVSVIRKPEKRKSGETNSGKSEDISLEGKAYKLIKQKIMIFYVCGVSMFLLSFLSDMFLQDIQVLF